MHSRRVLASSLFAAVLAACADAPPTEPGATPVIPLASVTAVKANPNMVVSAFVIHTASGDSARVRYRLTGQPSDAGALAASAAGVLDTTFVLGLAANAAYEFRVVAYGGTPARPESVVTVPQSFGTGALPADLPVYSASGTDSAGYVVFAAGPYGLAIDRAGRVVWYKRFPAGGPGLNFMAQPNGMYVGRYITDDPNDVDPMMEIDFAGFERRALRCVGRPLRFHDLLVMADGSYWLMCDDTRTVDMTAFGGQLNASVTGTAVQHVAADGATLLFEWTPFGQFPFLQADSSLYRGSSVNWTHGNSLDLDTDGHILISFRSLDEITKIHSQTGQVMWRMGGTANQFTFAGGAAAGFSRQHNVRVVGPGRFIVLDNTGLGMGESRFERYQVDAATLTATLEQSYASSPPVLTFIGGSVQATLPGRFLVSFGTEGRVEEFDTAGNLLWRIQGNPGYVFRAQRILSLYQPVPLLTR